MSIETLRTLLTEAVAHNYYDLIVLIKMELLEREFIENQNRLQRENENV